ncbi:hypothetical protein ACFVT8_21630 [Lysinibacillus sp. NPDC058147]|uniref:hypothetical protein n=1 Tax=unclassified Lysinibacillus TaxID=2636778 RepID=UPI0036D8D658
MAGRTQGSKILNTLWGEPGINISLTNTYSTSATLEGTMTGFDKSTVSAAVGFNVSKSFSVSYVGEYTAPTTHNGKK